MKATIKDKQALLAIDPASLEAYLTKNEWEQMDEVLRDEEVIGIRYKKFNETTHRWCYAKVMNDGSLPDYAARMAENLYEIELYEDKSQLQIYVDIMGEILIIVPDSMKAKFDSDMVDVMNGLS